MNRRISFRPLASLLALAALPVGLSAQNGDKEPKPGSVDAPPPAVDITTLRLGRDTLVAAPGEVYPAGPVHRFFLGDLNRHLWTLEIPVPVLDLDSVGGGLTVDELSGGKQTLGLRFKGEDGVIYQFRSIVKTAGRALPGPLRSTPLEDAFQDQMAAQFPLSAMVVAELLEAAGVLVAKPRPVIMPDDPRLGEWREAFAGRMGWIEVRPNEGEDDTPGFAGSTKITGSDELYEELLDDPNSHVDQKKLVRARLIDMFVGDWDRHSDQWRWAKFEEGNRQRWEPIPRDRDWALARLDGVFPKITSYYFPKYQGFRREYPDILALHWSAQRVDRTLLNGLERRDFLAAAIELRNTFTDDVIDRAVDVLPASYQRAVGDKLRRDLRHRRDGLVPLANEFYELLAQWVDVFGTEETDSVSVVPMGDSVRVTMWAPREGDFNRYDRTFHASETKDIRIYLRQGDDLAVVEGPSPIPVRLIGGEGDDAFVARGSASNVRIYDDQGDNEVDVGDEAFVTGSRYLRQDSIRTAYLLWDSRDWGSAWVPRPEARFDSDVGFFAGFGVARYGFGFGQPFYQSKFSLSVLNGMDPEQWIVDAEFDRALGDRGWRTVVSFDAFTDRPTWLFGFGNGVPAPGDENDFRSFRTERSVGVALEYRVSDSWRAFIGPTASFYGDVEPGGVMFDSLDVYGAGRFDQAGVQAGFDLDTRDSKAYPTGGSYVRLRTRAYPSLLDVDDTFGGLGLELRQYLAADVPLEPALHLRVTGEKVWGRTPFHELPYVGGTETMPGFVSRRFLGDAAASGTGLLRLKLLEPRVFTDLQLGVHGVATVGRVWYGDDPSEDWHVGTGGGAWLRLPGIDRTISVSLMKGDEGLRTYLDFGFLF